MPPRLKSGVRLTVLIMRLDPQVRKVYEEHGAVMSEAQLLERYLAYVILAIRASGNFTEEFRKISKKPLGKLIQELGEFFPVPSNFQARLHSIKVQRNWLAHEYFSDRAGLFQTTAGRAEMIRELDQIGDHIYRLWSYFDGLIVSWLAGANPTRESLIQDFTNTVHEA